MMSTNNESQSAKNIFIGLILITISIFFGVIWILAYLRLIPPYDEKNASIWLLIGAIPFFFGVYLLYEKIETRKLRINTSLISIGLYWMIFSIMMIVIWSIYIQLPSN